MTHDVSPERLREISRTIPKVAIVVGDEDHLVRVKNSFHLKQHMPEAEFVQGRHTIIRPGSDNGGSDTG